MSENSQKHPQTSMEAYRALQPEHLRKMYQRIINALQSLGTATYEELADCLNCREPNQISRRLKEMEKMELIWKPGGKRLTKRRRNAFVYQLTAQPKTDQEIKSQIKKDAPAAAQPTKKEYIAQTLFT